MSSESLWASCCFTSDTTSIRDWNIFNALTRQLPLNISLYQLPFEICRLAQTMCWRETSRLPSCSEPDWSVRATSMQSTTCPVSRETTRPRQSSYTSWPADAHQHIIGTETPLFRLIFRGTWMYFCIFTTYQSINHKPPPHNGAKKREKIVITEHAIS